MGWENINLNLMEAIDFGIKTQNLILPVFDNATNALNDEGKKYLARMDKQIAEAYERDEGEGGMMSQERDWEEDLHHQRLQSVGALALDWLMASVQVALRGAKSYLDKTHPAKSPYSKDEGWLGYAADEYQKRFGIECPSNACKNSCWREMLVFIARTKRFCTSTSRKSRSQHLSQRATSENTSS
jgi:hypothetical protein